MVENKTKSALQWALNIAIMLIIGAYGFIFTSLVDSIQDNKDGIKECFTKIETLNPTFSQIQADLSAIKTNQEWIKQKLDK